MSDGEKRVAPDELRRWAADLTSLVDLVEEAGRGCSADVDAGAVSGEVLERAATMLEGVGELTTRLRSMSDTLAALSLNYDLAEAEHAHTLGFALGAVENAGPPPEITDR